MSRRRRVLLSAAALFAAFLLGLLADVSLPLHQTPYEIRVFRRIDKGMTIGEVKAILGRPSERWQHSLGWSYDWPVGRGRIRATFDNEEERVRLLHFDFDPDAPQEGLLDRVRRWLGL